MKKKTVFVLALVVLAISVGLFAADLYVRAKLTDIKIVLDNNPLVLKNVNGTILKPLSYEGSTYLPVRAISENLGLEVQWDELTQTVTLTSKDEKKEPEKKDIEKKEPEKKDIEKEDKKDNKQENIKPIQKNQGAFTLGQKWLVPGQWEVTIDSVTETAERNQFFERKPAAVYIINYTYKNIGYNNESVEGLFITPNIDIIDATGKQAYTYPVTVSNNPKPTKIGETCTAQIAIGVDNRGNFITHVAQYNDKLVVQNAEFYLEVK